LEDRVLLAAANPVDLTMLDGTNGFQIEPVGFSEADSAGDVNGGRFR
jgi:hypothetical protein